MTFEKLVQKRALGEPSIAFVTYGTLPYVAVGPAKVLSLEACSVSLKNVNQTQILEKYKVLVLHTIIFYSCIFKLSL